LLEELRAQQIAEPPLVALEQLLTPRVRIVDRVEDQQY
jgi:hypothetical protein